MTPEQIREVVKATLDELDSRKQLQSNNYPRILKTIEKRLYKFFDGNKDTRLKNILLELSDDTYIDIIYLIYRDGKTIEWIAEYMSKSVLTIKRNKKRLIYKMYELLEE